jgi:hypothetical protein
MDSRSPMMAAALAFMAGFIATLVFHQTAVAGLDAAGLMPAGFKPWSFDPVPPLAVPTVLSKAFWGGLWAILLYFVLRRMTGAGYWLGWTILGAVALPLVAIFVVPVLKGQPVPPFMERFPVYALVNAAWGFGTAMLLRFLR